jgi:hypothetical protein
LRARGAAFATQIRGNQFPKNSFHGQTGRFGGRRKTGIVRVTGYRLYGLDGVSKVSSGEWFEADDDETAVEVAKTMMDGHDCELWQGKRFVTRIARQHRRR